MTEAAVVIDGIGVGGGIGLFLLGVLFGFLLGWVMGVFQADAELGVQIKNTGLHKDQVSGSVSIEFPDRSGPTPKAES